MKLADAEGWRVRPAGAMMWPGSPANVIIISTSRLNQIIEHEPADLIAVAQAGVKLADFNTRLEENGQWLPLDPPDDGRATIGGVVATGIGGAQQFGYGRPRGSVIGMKVVLADGSMIKAGGRVVKNVAGYDLCKLFTGSFGTLGVIAEINFKLRPRPAREATVIASGEKSDLLARARAVLDARLFPVAAEMISPVFANRLGVGRDPVLLIRFAGNEKGVAYQIEQCLKVLQKAELISDDNRLWKEIAAAPFRFEDYNGMWQTGALDGRVTSFENTTPELVLTPLMKRVKEQLDPGHRLDG